MATFPTCRRMIETARRHRARLMVDEAHALGTVGPRGFGLAEHFGIDAAEIDIWMGTLSKTLAGAGGYIAGRAPADRVSQIHRAGFRLFRRHAAAGRRRVAGRARDFARRAGTRGAAQPQRDAPSRRPRRTRHRYRCVGGQKHCAGDHRQLDRRRAARRRVVPPASSTCSRSSIRRSRSAPPRLRFFLSSEHTDAQIDATIAAVAEESAAIAGDKIDPVRLAQRVAAATPER